MNTSHSELRKVIENIVKINEESWSEFESKITNKELKKGDFLWREGQVCRSLVFLQKGLIRTVSFKNEREVTHTIYEESSLFYDDYSFLSQNPCKKSFEALEDCQLSLSSRSDLFTMYDRHKSFERLGRIAVETAHVRMIENIERINLNSAEENYMHLLDSRPHLIQRISQKIIASYLNVTTEHLSRIRRNIVKKPGQQ